MDFWLGFVGDGLHSCNERDKERGSLGPTVTKIAIHWAGRLSHESIVVDMFHFVGGERHVSSSFIFLLNHEQESYH